MGSVYKNKEMLLQGKYSAKTEFYKKVSTYFYLHRLLARTITMQRDTMEHDNICSNFIGQKILQL